MASFELILDTTGPDVTISAPSYTIPQEPTEILVLADEQLAPYQSFYTIDSQGTRRDVIFEFLGDSFRGILNFNDYPLGFVTVYADVKDEVFNPSNVATAVINLQEGARLFLETSISTRELSVGQAARGIMLGQAARNVETVERVRDITTGVA